MIQPKLSEVLEEKSKTLYWLAKETGIAYSTLHRFNTSQTKGIDYHVLDGICLALDCQPGDLLVRVPEGAVGKPRPTKKAAKK